MDRWKISTGNGLCVQDCRSISYVANLVDQPIKGLEMRMGIAHWWTISLYSGRVVLGESLLVLDYLSLTWHSVGQQ